MPDPLEKVTVGALTMTRAQAEKQLADIKASPAYKRAEAKYFDNLTDANEQQASYMADLYEDALGEADSKAPSKKKKKIDIAPTKEELDQQRKDNFERTTKKIFNRLISNIKLKEGKFTLKFIDDPNQDSGWIQGKTIYINKARVDIGTALHEISHPIVTMLRVSNPKLFNNIYKEIIKSKMLDTTRIRLEYEKDPDATEIDIQEEIVVRGIEKTGKGNLYKQNSKNKLVIAIQDFFSWLFEKLGLKTKVVIFGSEANMLTPSTTLKELTNIITNFNNRYEIHLDENAFDEINDISNEGLDTVSNPKDTYNTITNSIVSTEIERVKNEGVGMLLKAKKKIDPIPVIEKWIESIEKTYKITRKKYGGKWHIENKKGIDQAKEIMQKDLDNALGLYDIKKLDLKKLDDKMTEVAGALVLMNEKVVFHYKPVDILLENPNALYTVDDMLKMPGIKKNEQDNIKKFVSEFKKENPGIKSLKRSELAGLYSIFSNKQTGLSYVVSTDFYDSLDSGLDMLMGSESGHQTYRMVAHMNKGYMPMHFMVHSFEELEGSTGVGWYTVTKTPDGGKLLYEYQSDVLREFLSALKKTDELSGKILTEKDVNKFADLKDVIDGHQPSLNHMHSLIPVFKTVHARLSNEWQFNGLRA